MINVYKQLMVSVAILLTLSLIIVPQQAKGDDTYVKIQEMVNDLGGPAHQKENNGKVQRCVNGGTKKITIKGGTYQGVYNNCREYGRTRGGEVVISTGGGFSNAASNKEDTANIAFEAAFKGDAALLEKALKKKKNIVNKTETIPAKGGGETRGWTMLMSAVQGNHKDVVGLLVKYGANINMQNSGNNSALDIAVNKGNSEIVEYLLLKKAKVNNIHTIPNSEGGETAGWTSLMTASQNNYTEIVRLLVASGANVNALSSEKTSALWIAANKGNADIVEYLLSKGAEKDVQDSYGMSPLMTAAAIGSLDTVNVLIKAKAKLDLKHKDGDTALFFAIKQTPVALSLINAGAGLDFMNKFGATPLLLAVDKNNIQVTRRLLEMGAKAGFEEAVRIANKIGDQDMINLLNSFGGVK